MRSILQVISYLLISWSMLVKTILSEQVIVFDAYLAPKLETEAGSSSVSVCDDMHINVKNSSETRYLVLELATIRNVTRITRPNRRV